MEPPGCEPWEDEFKKAKSDDPDTEVTLCEVLGDKLIHASRRALINLLIWIRMISFLRMFKTTRIFIYMLLEVLVDLVGFLVILVLFLGAFTTSRSILDVRNELSAY